MQRLERFFVAALLGCTPIGDETTGATMTTTGEGSTTGEGGETEAGTSASTTGATTEATTEATTSAATEATTTEATTIDTASSTSDTSGGDTEASGCGDGVATPGELCFIHVEGQGFAPGLLAAGDLDGDGHLDLVGIRLLPCPYVPDDGLSLAARPGGREGSYFVTLAASLGDGAGGFIEAANFDPSAGEPKALALADVDGDGDLDALIASTSGELYVLAGDGAGSFVASTVVQLPYDVFAAVDLAPGDLDGDGAIDVVVVAPAGLMLLAGDGVGGFEVTQVPKDAALRERVNLYDLDGDGDLDALSNAYSEGVSTLEIWRGAGDGTLTADQMVEFPGVAVDLAVLPEGEGGAPQVLVSAYGDELFLLAFPVGAGGVLGAPVVVAAETQDRLAIGDLDGDGRGDLARLGYDRWDALLGADAWPSPPLEFAESLTNAPRWARAGDFNEDGVDDVALSLDELLLSNP